MAQTLEEINQKFATLRIVKFTGGTMRNAITRECNTVVALQCSDVKKVIDIVNELREGFVSKYSDGNLIEMNVYDKFEKTYMSALTNNSTNKLIKTILGIPNGVLEKYDESLVKTSCNLGVIRQESNYMFFCSFVRSFVREEKLKLVADIKSKVEGVDKDVKFNTEHDSPSWEPNNDSDLKNRFISAYSYVFKVEPKVKSIHAGLECGYFAEKFPGMDMISCGPTLFDVHTPDEIMYTDTVIKVTELLLNVLNDMKPKS